VLRVKERNVEIFSFADAMFCGFQSHSLPERLLRQSLFETILPLERLGRLTSNERPQTSYWRKYEQLKKKKYVKRRGIQEQLSSDSD
jgi:hypothetical protein